MDAQDEQLARVRGWLDARNLAYEVMDCDPELADTANFCAHYGVPLHESANTILVASKRQPPSVVACVVLADSRLDVNGIVKRRMNAGKVSFASADATVERTGMTIGGVTAFGLPDDMPVWIDRRVMEQQVVVLGGGSRSAKISVAPEVLLAIDGAEVVDGLANPINP